MNAIIPGELLTDANRQVLDHIKNMSAHSDVVSALTVALKPLGDVQLYCPDPQNYRYVVGSTNGVIFALALGMQLVCFRLDKKMKTRALACGGASYPELGDEWVSFTLFRDDWPAADLQFWARKAYVAAREAMISSG